jgi:hypothetical protein
MTESNPSRQNPLLRGLNLKPIAAVTTSIGELQLFSLNLSDVLRLGNSQHDEDPTADLQFMREVVRLIAFPTASLVDGKLKPEEPVLQPQQLAALKENDLEHIADSFLKHETFFYMSRVEERATDAKGVVVSGFRDGALVHPRLPEETLVRYLKRLLKISATQWENAEREYLNKLRASFPGRVFRKIQSTNAVGDQLLVSAKLSTATERLEESSKMTVPVAEANISRSIPRLDLDGLHEAQREAFNEPFRRVGEQLDQLLGKTALVERFLVSSNDTQTGISLTLKETADEIRTVGRATAYMTAVVLMLTVVAVGTTWYQIHEDSKARLEERDATGRHVETIKSGIDTLTVQVRKSQAESAEIVALTKQIQELQAVVERQERDFAEARKKKSLPGAQK